MELLDVSAGDQPPVSLGQGPLDTDIHRSGQESHPVTLSRTVRTLPFGISHSFLEILEAGGDQCLVKTLCSPPRPPRRPTPPHPIKSEDGGAQMMK